MSLHSELLASISDPVFAGFVDVLLNRYYETSLTAVKVIRWLRERHAPVIYDHFAFRSFGANGLGIVSLAKVFTDSGYTQQDRLDFPAKKITAFWYKPPPGKDDWPRIFISELKVTELSEKAQQIISSYLDRVGPHGGEYAAMCAAAGIVPWGRPKLEDYEALYQESEYAAWTLANAFVLNHTTISVHRLSGLGGGLEKLNEEVQRLGVSLNSGGGEVKVSPDRGLRQSSTVADSMCYRFSSDKSVERFIAGSYLEFAERLPLPEFSHLPAGELREHHRRDGFEVGNADKIFESTSRRQQERAS